MKDWFHEMGRDIVRLHIKERIRRQNARFSITQQRIADYVIGNYRKAAFLNSSKLAKVLNVSQATLYRFAVLLGYQGFPQMQSAIQDMVLAELTTEDRMDLSSQEARSWHTARTSQRPSYERILASEIETMRTLFHSLKEEDFTRAVDMMFEAEKIFVVGLLGSAALAQYFAYNLRKLRPDVVVIEHGDSDDLFKFQMVDPSSVVIIITFPRYPRLTMRFAAFAHRQKARIIGLTNNVLSPIASFCDVGFYIDTRVTSFMDSFAAPISVIHALTAEFSQRDLPLTKRRLGEYEELVKRERLFHPT